MPTALPFTGERKTGGNDAAGNLVSLVDYLVWMKSVKTPRPKWSKFDTKTSMSDNNGGMIKF